MTNYNTTDKYETKIEDIEVGDTVIAKWGADCASYAIYVFRVKSKTDNHLFDGVGLFPAQHCKFYVLGDSYSTISGDVILP